MKKILCFFLAAAMAASLTACGGSSNQPAPAPAANAPTPAAAEPAPVPESAEQFKVAMVTDVGGVNDESFNQSAWEGLQRAEKELGMKVSYQESQQEANYGPNLERLTDAGNDLIWGVGFMMGDAILNAAKLNPEQQYAIVDNAYAETPSNLTAVVFRAQEPSFLVGYMAGRMTQTDKVGFVGGIAGEIIGQFEYGYRGGVAYAANELGKDIEVLVQYADSFSDDAKGKAIATTMYTNGADIVFHAAGGVGMGVISAAKEMDKYVIGVDLDQSSLAPDHVITSALKLVGAAMYDVSKDMSEGISYGGQTRSYGIKEGACGIPDNASTQKLVDKAIYDDTLKVSDDIASDKISVPHDEASLNAFVGAF